MRVKNLEAEFKRAGVSTEQVANALGVSYLILRNRLAGRTEWHLKEMLKIQAFMQEKTGKKFTLDYLFAATEN